MEDLTVQECRTGNKPWYTSKVLWVNTLAGIGIIVQAATGTDIISPDTQALIITGINIFLRFLTTKSILKSA